MKSVSDPEILWLKKSDPKLFTWRVNHDAVHKKGSSEFAEMKKNENENRSYENVCSKKGVKVMSIKDFEKNKENLEYGIRTGSDKNTCKDNVYVCPRFWCPRSRVSVSSPDAVCPSGEKPEQSEFVFPVFMKRSSHPRNLTLPCCAKLKKSYQFDEDNIALSPSCVEEKQIPKCSKIAYDTDEVKKKLFKFNAGTDKIKKLYELENPNIVTTFNSAFENDPIPTILKNMTIRDFVLVDGGYKLKAFYDPGMRQSDEQNEFSRFLKDDKTLAFMKSFGIQAKEAQKPGTDSSHFMFIIFNSMGNFRDYLESDVRKIYDDFIGFTHFKWFNTKKIGVLFYELHSDSMKLNVEKSALSTDFQTYCCFVDGVGYITPVFYKTSVTKNKEAGAKVCVGLEGVSLVKLQLKDGDLKDLLTEEQYATFSEDTAQNHARSKLPKNKSPDKYVLDYNMKICGCVNGKEYIQFEKQFDIAPPHDNVSYVLISSVKNDKSEAMLFNLSEESTEHGNLCSLIEQSSATTKATTKVTTKAVAKKGKKEGKSVKEEKRKEKEKGNGTGEWKLKDIANDLYYLRHSLHPMVLDVKMKYLMQKYAVSENLARCLLQVYDVEGLFEAYQDVEHPVGKTKKISYDPNKSDFAKILNHYRNPYMKMFDSHDA